MSIISLLGETLRLPEGKTVSTAEAVGDKSVLGLYFSAHWCPPCRGFTPTLAEKYVDLKDADKDFELVFVSSDKDEAAFNEYHDSMTFPALHFADREAKAKLSKKFKVSGIPSLIFFDLKTNKLITDEGREEISQASYIDKFPYRSEPVNVIETLGSVLRKPDDTTVATSEALADKSVLGLYFSAHWCPPCRGFTPKLSENYTKLKEAGKDFEMVFLSSDRDEAAFKEYHNEMTFLALPYSEREAKEKLSKHFKVQGIPTLVFIDAKTGDLITDEGRGAISAPTFIEDYPFTPKPVNDLSATASGIDSNVSLVVLMESASKEDQDVLTAMVTKLAEKEFEKDEDTRVVEKFFTGKGGGPVGRVRSGCGMKPAEEAKAPAMLLLDLSDEGAYYHPDEACAKVTSANIEAFVEAFKNGKLEKKTFG